MKVIRVQSEEQVSSVRELIREYTFSLGVDLHFQGLAQELAGLPGEYSEPDGGLLAVDMNGRLIGCVALRKLEPRICEMKRMYVKPEFRGRGIGRMLAEAVVQNAREIGYEKMRLDTLSRLEDAISLYTSMGFQEIEPYIYNPLPGVRFLELNIQDG
ncbi:MAG: GNAT family N-acetyltransferase [Firmicutes bacterium]|nr:GNAT family N-acetyltransferase [Bacillota bacterium]